MLDIKWIRDNPKALVEALVKRSWPAGEAQSTVDDLVAKDEARRSHLSELQVKQERRNAASKEIGNAMRSGDLALAEKLKGEVSDIKVFIQNGEARERELDKALDDALAVLPNVPLDDVPVGKDEHNNEERHRFPRDFLDLEKPLAMRPPSFPFVKHSETSLSNAPRPREHFEIGEALGMMDFERAAKLSGSRFTVLKGGLARLERALGQFMLNLHTNEHEYTEIQPPLLVNSDAMYGTGQLPKFGEDLFFSTEKRQVDQLEKALKSSVFLFQNFKKNSANTKIQSFSSVINSLKDNFSQDFVYSVALNALAQSDVKLPSPRWKRALERQAKNTKQGTPTKLWMIPTAEVPLTNMVRGQILDSDSLPLRYVALTPCFRLEAGSAGRDTRGMLRQHQFYKVELVSITDQENSIKEHERMTECAEAVLKKLELPFRTVTLCTGDMGFGARKTYDIEVWLPGQNAYREISSCSVCGDFQARRMDARYKDKDGKGNRFVHTLNGSGTAVGRALIAVIENYQNEDGSVTIPEVLRPYMGGLTKIESK
ncbi:serine--tRNA ligase [Mesorhizobium sp. B3-1-6]|uniref:serine--tRNA ligase n=1 Tax=Mesorhizobium sp. B3-1-6 TaxID=2589895 RepID=UPI00112BF727|nr:serine--tRNA ligase [Mesorhizobium sp. B3-1-6]TPI31459.1 serine--tRNA ligase [Mesorhizobium sp. B3-1-6]